MPPKPVSRGVSIASSRAGAAGKSTTGRQQPAAKRPTPGAGPGGRGRAPAGSSAVKKGGTVAPGRGKAAAPSGKNVKGPVAKAKPAAPVWSKQDDMARRIQTMYRAYRARKMLLTLKKKKEEYDSLMDKLQREAFVKMAKLEQERAEQQRRRDEEALKRRKEHLSRIKRMLEAAFDGDTDQIKKLLKEVAKLHSEAGEAMVSRYQHKLVECSDPNSNTPLSEAGAGGDPDTIRLLVQLGADPNVRCQYGRTSLYRAAFAGHLDAVKVLLELGADPRITADDGATPEQVAAQAPVGEVLKSWDIAVTEKLLEGLERDRTKRLDREKQIKQAAEDVIQSEIAEAEKEYSSNQKQLSKAHEELNKRILEHDEYGATKGDITLPAVHDAEDWLEKCKIHAEEARKKLQQVRLKLRMKRKEFQDVGAEGDEEEAEKADVIINIKELDDVLFKDVGNKIAASGKWPLIIDSGQQAATFLRYRDTNYMNVCNPRNMESESIRMALVGALRYGKFAVIDLLDIEDSWTAVKVKFDVVKKDLLSQVMSKEIVKDEKYLSLVKPSDGEEYSAKMFGSRTQNFKLVIVTQLLSPPAEITDHCYVIRIHTPQDLGY